jgi:hypothetical protein
MAEPMSDELKVGDHVRFTDTPHGTTYEVMGIADSGLFLAPVRPGAFGEHPKDKVRRTFYSIRPIRLV